MMRVMLKSKISYAKVVELELYYQGSITIDKNLMDAADLCEGERVDVLNLNNGLRFQTYVIAGKAGSGKVGLNGPAARLAHLGDKIIIVSYGLYGESEIKEIKPKILEVDDENKVKNT